MLHAVVMAGGSGTRFWPESRKAWPKQLLSLASNETLIQATLRRLGDLVPRERVLIATNQSLAAAIAGQLPELPASAILGEPCKRDTAPCIGLAAIELLQSDPEATMIVMPSDHVIRPDEAFQQALRLAAALVEESPGRLLTFGIRPTYAAEIFGYIERGEALAAPRSFAGQQTPAIYRVARFREKPKADVAAEYLRSGKFFWNSGIFVWKARTILDELRRRAPDMCAHLDRIAAARGSSQFDEVLAREFAAIQGISIDFAVMEHATDVAVIEAPFEWDDVGSWRALARLRGTDEDENTIAARHVGINTRGSIIRSADDRHLIATMGVENLIIVHTPEATLVANKQDEESIRHLIKLLEERGLESYL